MSPFLMDSDGWLTWMKVIITLGKDAGYHFWWDQWVIWWMKWMWSNLLIKNSFLYGFGKIHQPNNKEVHVGDFSKPVIGGGVVRRPTFGIRRELRGLVTCEFRNVVISWTSFVLMEHIMQIRLNRMHKLYTSAHSSSSNEWFHFSNIVTSLQW